MRLLGDEYIKSEFRLHRSIDNPVHIVGFLTEWQMYAQQIEGENWRGELMDRTKIDKMSGESEWFCSRCNTLLSSSWCNHQQRAHKLITSGVVQISKSVRCTNS
jgi:hypothetical protein